jgi:hypothetical protein
MARTVAEVNMINAILYFGAAVQTVPAVPVLSRRSLALGRPACSSRKPQLRLSFPIPGHLQQKAPARPAP